MDTSLERVDTILFTHHHFLGASNLYRKHFSAKVHIHHADSDNDLSRSFSFDETFAEDFIYRGIKAFHVDGHTPGFTFYIFEETLFICDYVFLDQEEMKLNPFGQSDRTISGARRVRELLDGRSLATVCGYNYVMDYTEWWDKFEAGPPFAGF